MNHEDSNKSFVIQITDKELLEKTGGIVQGMSGSPVLQNGKLFGAVTHVFVQDSTGGYGIFIENMTGNAVMMIRERGTKTWKKSGKSASFLYGEKCRIQMEIPAF